MPLFLSLRIVPILGNLPPDLLGKKCFDFIAVDDKQNVQLYKNAISCFHRISVLIKSRGEYLT